MSSPSLHRLRGPFNFLDPRAESIQTSFPDAERLLPRPVQIFLEDEHATPVYGFPVTRSAGIQGLAEDLRAYLESEERAQMVGLRRGSVDFDIRRHQQAWDRYGSGLTAAANNLMTSSYGRDFPQLFWLYHSLDLVAALKGTANRVRQLNLEIGRQRGDAIRYVVLFKYLERVFSLLYDLASKLADEVEEVEEELFPPLLTRMRDNVLILTEDHIGSDLNELKGYFRGYLKIDSRDFLYRLALLRRWHADLVQNDVQLRAAAKHLVRAVSGTTADQLLLHPGYLAFLRRHRRYDERRFLSEQEVRLWDGLLVKLKEFELFHGVRRQIVELETREGKLWCDGRAAQRVGAGSGPVVMNPETRPLDFSASWVVDPEVSRGGLIYDLIDFSALVSRLRMGDGKAQDDSFRQVFLFQRQVNRLAQSQRLRMEKYLGDGAFYSGRNVRRMLIAALEIQQTYRRALDSGLPFDRGLRIALNFGTYRLLPLGTTREARYEVFGHGLVELSRLVSGKRGLEIDEVKRLLVIRGYDENAVHDFFAPLASADQQSRAPGERRYAAHLEVDGSLVNQGIVVTAGFLAELDRQSPAGPGYLIEQSGERFVAFELVSDQDVVWRFGVRRLGLASLKGLDRVDTFEIVDGSEWSLSASQKLAQESVLDAARECFTTSLAGS